jgi:hypothetical protein
VKVIFAHPRHRHPSYADYRKLVEISGFETCAVDEMDLAADAIYITAPVNGELRPVVDGKKRRAKVIFWCLERPDSGDWPPEGNNASNRVGEIIRFVDKVWVSDRHQAQLDLRQVFVPLASDSRLAEGETLPAKMYDLAMLSYVTDRRRKIVTSLERWKRAPETAWGETRARILHSSRSMLYIHQTPSPIVAPLRFALAAAYKLPLLSEAMADPYPLVSGKDFLSAPYEGIVEATNEWLSGPSLAPYGQSLHETLCLERNFRLSVLEGVVKSFS